MARFRSSRLDWKPPGFFHGLTSLKKIIQLLCGQISILGSCWRLPSGLLYFLPENAKLYRRPEMMTNIQIDKDTENEFITATDNLYDQWLMDTSPEDVTTEEDVVRLRESAYRYDEFVEWLKEEIL